MNYQIFSTLTYAEITATQIVLQEILNQQYSRPVFNTDQTLKAEYDNLAYLVSELDKQAGLKHLDLRIA